MEQKPTWKDQVSYYVRYYGVYVLGIVLLVGLVAGMLCSGLRKEPEPDYQIAVMTGQEPSPEDLQALEQAFQACGRDRTGDGTLWVRMRPFAYGSGKQPGAASLGQAYEAVAETVWFAAENQEGTCVLYVLTPQTMEALRTQDPDFFLPLSQCLPGVTGDTVPLPPVPGLGEGWEDFCLAIRNPQSGPMDDSRAYWEDSLALLQALLDQQPAS